MTIGIFDSGLGGLSVLYQARRLLPGERFLYYADRAHVPYGEKDPAAVRAYAEAAIRFLVDRGAGAVVIACNTATSVLPREDRAGYPVPVLGMEPAVKKALDDYGGEGKKVLVAATPVTIRGRKLAALLDRLDCRDRVVLAELPGLVRLAEAGVFSGPQVADYLAGALDPAALAQCGTVVLGCTHFNYFKESLAALFPRPVHFVDGNEGTLRHLMALTALHPETAGGGSAAFFFSGRPVTAAERENIDACLARLAEEYVI